MKAGLWSEAARIDTAAHRHNFHTFVLCFAWAPGPEVIILQKDKMSPPSAVRRKILHTSLIICEEKIMCPSQQPVCTEIINLNR